MEPGTAIDIKGSTGAEAVTYRYNASIEAPTKEEAPDYVAGSTVGVTLVVEDGKKLLDTANATFPLSVNFHGLTSPRGTITFSYTVTTDSQTVTNESGETTVIPGTIENRSFTREVEFERE